MISQYGVIEAALSLINDDYTVVKNLTTHYYCNNFPFGLTVTFSLGVN